MSKCPKCKQEISYLHLYEETRFNFELDANKEPFAFQAQPTEAESYECPECCEEIFGGEDEAVTFLKGDKNDN